MAILESGVMFGGMPIVKKSYYDEKSTSTILTTGLLEAIQSFAVEVFNDETETFRMKKYSIYLHKIKLSSNQIVTIYCICDSTDRINIVKEIMKSIANKFIIEFPNVDLSCLDNYKAFEEIITKGFGDLIYRSDERLRKIFFDI
ncbi:MAG: hypothetical protein JXA54_09570 [Candidatus Heimdallarchaeota archaeon]|nr:hypothetical protein [Candidatus Heimdallarchaeota archaeon]